jgi:hypothetical protein
MGWASGKRKKNENQKSTEPLIVDQAQFQSPGPVGLDKDTCKAQPTAKDTRASRVFDEFK